ncbi:MAG TPA: trypsin-like peptidase domain-containing protein [Acidimicrobiia bacterium]|nr:trypsin-like peptidase domain-containing protein [Acidimicrobiia bacterium]
MPFEDPGNEGRSRPPPDPLDRLWIHPSELASTPRTRTAGPNRGLGRSDWLVVVAAGALGAVVTIAVLAATGVLTPTKPPEAVSAQPVAALAARAAPGVVGVVAATAGAQRRGSGLVIDDGWVLASCATVNDAASLAVTDGRGRTLPATLHGCDGVTGLALLYVDGIAGGLPSGDERKVEVGDTVIALGAGSGEHNWVATGVVSSVSAVLAADEVAQTGLIGTDARIVSGATGGALLDDRGHIVGILALAPDRGGLAVPIGRARRIAAQLRETGRVAHGWIGIAGADATSEPGGGVVVGAVVADGPADRAGIMVGDIVIGAEGDRINAMTDLLSIARSHSPDERLALQIRRDEEDLTRLVRLGDVPRTPEPGEAAPDGPMPTGSDELTAATPTTLVGSASPSAGGSG